MTENGAVLPEHALAADQVIGAGRPQSVGSFRVWFSDQRWEWSDEVANMHGYLPGTVQPTTELLLQHKHPDDREQVASVLERSLREAEPFSSRHRIIDTTGNVHHVIVVADQLLADGGKVVGTSGYYIDVTETLAEYRKETLNDSLPELVAARAVIEQAKGALMLVYGINENQAFRVLRWRSQDTNVKLRSLAAGLVADLPALMDAAPNLRTRFDHVLLTAHERIPE